MGSGRCGSRRTKMLACTLYCFMSIRGASDSGLARAGARQDDVAVGGGQLRWKRGSRRGVKEVTW